MSLAEQRVAVIGAGIGGLAAAIALAERGAHVEVFEQAPALTDVGAGIQIGPNGVAVLEALGLRDGAERLAATPQGVELRDHRGDRMVARVPLGHAAATRYGRPYWQFHRADLLSVLVAGAAEAGVALRLGRKVARVSAVEDGVAVETEDGGTSTVSIAIGADGVRSAVRAAHFDAAPPRFTGHVAWRGLVDAASLPEGLFPDGACVTMGPRRHLVTYPLRGGRLINFVAVEERAGWTDEGWTAPDDPDNLRRAFAGSDMRPRRCWRGSRRRFFGDCSIMRRLRRGRRGGSGFWATRATRCCRFWRRARRWRWRTRGCWRRNWTSR